MKAAIKHVLGLAILLGTLPSTESPAEETTVRKRAVTGKVSAPTSAVGPSRPRHNASSRSTRDEGDQLSSEQSARLQESLQKKSLTERLMSNTAKNASETTEFIKKPIKN